MCCACCSKIVFGIVLIAICWIAKKTFVG